MVSSRLAQPRFGVQHKTRRTDATKQKTVKRRIAKIEIKKAKKKARSPYGCGQIQFKKSWRRQELLYRIRRHKSALFS